MYSSYPENFKVIAQMKVCFVNSELFVSDDATRSGRDHVTQLDFTTLNILIFICSVGMLSNLNYSANSA